MVAISSPQTLEVPTHSWNCVFLLIFFNAGCLCSSDAQQWMGVAILRSDWLESSCRHRGWKIVITGMAGGGGEKAVAFVRLVDDCSHLLRFQEWCIQKVTAVKEIFVRRDLSVSLWILTRLIRHHSLSDMKVSQAFKCLGLKMLAHLKSFHRNAELL